MAVRPPMVGARRRRAATSADLGRSEGAPLQAPLSRPLSPELDLPMRAILLLSATAAVALLAGAALAQTPGAGQVMGPAATTSGPATGTDGTILDTVNGTSRPSADGQTVTV